MQGRAALARLKHATADLHLEAERHVRILDADASVDDYRRYLCAMHGYHAPIESRLAGLDVVGFDSAARRRAHLAVLDLATLGAAPDAPCFRLPAGDNLDALLGMAYVIEGSTLGGRFIVAKLPPAIAPLRGHATRFLAGYGAATGARWREFGALVERVLADDTAVERAVVAARETFTTLTAWLARHEPRVEVRAS